MAQVKTCPYCEQTYGITYFPIFKSSTGTMQRRDVCYYCLQDGYAYETTPKHGVWDLQYWTVNVPEKLGFKSIIPSGGL